MENNAIGQFLTQIDPNTLKIIIAILVVLFVISLIKKAIKLAIVVFVAVLIFSSTGLMASNFQEKYNIKAEDGQIVLTVDGKQIKFGDDKEEDRHIQGIEMTKNIDSSYTLQVTYADDDNNVTKSDEFTIPNFMKVPLTGYINK